MVSVHSWHLMCGCSFRVMRRCGNICMQIHRLKRWFSLNTRLLKKQPCRFAHLHSEKVILRKRAAICDWQISVAVWKFSVRKHWKQLTTINVVTILSSAVITLRRLRVSRWRIGWVKRFGMLLRTTQWLMMSWKPEMVCPQQTITSSCVVGLKFHY